MYLTHFLTNPGSKYSIPDKDLIWRRHCLDQVVIVHEGMIMSCISLRHIVKARRIPSFFQDTHHRFCNDPKDEKI
jgi:hypothetical protein